MPLVQLKCSVGTGCCITQLISPILCVNEWYFLPYSRLLPPLTALGYSVLKVRGVCVCRHWLSAKTTQKKVALSDPSTSPTASAYWSPKAGGKVWVKANSPAQMYCGWFCVPNLCSFPRATSSLRHFLVIESQGKCHEIPKKRTPPPANPFRSAIATLDKLKVA